MEFATQFIFGRLGPGDAPNQWSLVILEDGWEVNGLNVARQSKVQFLFQSQWIALVQIERAAPLMQSHFPVARQPHRSMNKILSAGAGANPQTAAFCAPGKVFVEFGNRTE